MTKNSIWTNQAFCFRVSVVFVFVWLALSSTISLILYLSFGEGIVDDFILEFSSWFFIIPAITFFGLINALPLMIDWVLEPFKNTEAVTNVNSNKSIHSTSYSQLASQLKPPTAATTEKNP